MMCVVTYGQSPERLTGKACQSKGSDDPHLVGASCPRCSENPFNAMFGGDNKPKAMVAQLGRFVVMLSARSLFSF